MLCMAQTDCRLWQKGQGKANPHALTVELKQEQARALKAEQDLDLRADGWLPRGLPWSPLPGGEWAREQEPEGVWAGM